MNTLSMKEILRVTASDRGDAMNTPTPRTDAIAVVIGPDNSIRYTTPDDPRVHTAFEVVDANQCRKFERDLAAAQAELAQERERANKAEEEDLKTRMMFHDMRERAERAEESLAFVTKANAQLMWIDHDMAAKLERAEALAEKNARDAERIDWMERALFDKWWNGVIDSGSRTYWRICGPYRHVTAKMVGHTFRAALDAAIAGEKK